MEPFDIPAIRDEFWMAGYSGVTWTENRETEFAMCFPRVGYLLPPHEVGWDEPYRFARTFRRHRLREHRHARRPGE